MASDESRKGGKGRIAQGKASSPLCRIATHRIEQFPVSGVVAARMCGAPLPSDSRGQSGAFASVRYVLLVIGYGLRKAHGYTAGN